MKSPKAAFRYPSVALQKRPLEVVPAVASQRFIAIFCDHCSFMAAAELNDELLCIRCLQVAVNRDHTGQRVSRIIPLAASELAQKRARRVW